MENIIITLGNILKIKAENTGAKDLQLFAENTQLIEVEKNINRTLVNSWLKEKKYNQVLTYIDGIYSKKFNVEHIREGNGVAKIVLKPKRLIEKFDLLPLERKYNLSDIKALYSPEMYRDDSYNHLKASGEITQRKSLYTMINNMCMDKAITITDMDKETTIKGLIKIHCVLSALATQKQLQTLNDNMLSIANTSKEVQEFLLNNYDNLMYKMVYDFIGELNSHDQFKCSKSKAIELVDYLVIVPWETFGMKTATEYFIENKFDNDSFIYDCMLHLSNAQADQIKSDYRVPMQRVLNNRPTKDQISDLVKLQNLVGYKIPYGYITRLSRETVEKELTLLRKEYSQTHLKDNSIISLADFSKVELGYKKSKEFEELKEMFPSKKVKGETDIETLKNYKRYSGFVRSLILANGEPHDSDLFDELEGEPAKVYDLYMTSLRSGLVNFGQFENLPLAVKQYLVGVTETY